jgi:hypothetical protein
MRIEVGLALSRVRTALATAGCRRTFLLPGVRQTDARQTFVNDDLPFLHRLLLMPMREEEANVAYNFILLSIPFFTATLSRKSLWKPLDQCLPNQRSVSDYFFLPAIEVL